MPLTMSSYKNSFIIVLAFCLAVVTILGSFRSSSKTTTTTTNRNNTRQRSRNLSSNLRAHVNLFQKTTRGRKECPDISHEGKEKTFSSLIPLFEEIEQKTEGRVCGRRVPTPFNYNEVLTTPLTTKRTTSRNDNRKIVMLLGFDNYLAGTNNRILAILRGIDYAADNNYDLALSRNGWAHNILKEFFWTVKSSNRNDKLNDVAWESIITSSLGISILGNKDIICLEETKRAKILYIKAPTVFNRVPHRKGNELALHQQTRRLILSFLWSHPARHYQNPQEDICTVVESSLPSSTDYSVVHLRWLEGSCFGRLERASKKMQTKAESRVGRRIVPGMLDPNVACEMPPSYIIDILSRRKMLDKPLFLISDGQRPQIMERILTDETLRKIARPVSEEVSWVGGDMMLAVLAHTFIGSPVSSVSEMVGQSRMALGFDAKSNFIYARRKMEGDEHWDFLFKEEFVTLSSDSMMELMAEQYADDI